MNVLPNAKNSNRCKEYVIGSLNLCRNISDAAETGNRHAWIEAVYGVGYRFEYSEE